MTYTGQQVGSGDAFSCEEEQFHIRPVENLTFGVERVASTSVTDADQIAAADAQASHWPGIEVGDQPGDRLVELGQREEAAIMPWRFVTSLSTRIRCRSRSLIVTQTKPHLPAGDHGQGD